MCTTGCHCSRHARLITSFLRSVASLRDGSTAACHGAILAGTGGLKAAFFGYFLCRGKESNCRPAQGQRPRREGATRMPAKTQRRRHPKQHHIAKASRSLTHPPKTLTASPAITSAAPPICAADKDSPRKREADASPTIGTSKEN